MKKLGFLITMLVIASLPAWSQGAKSIRITEVMTHNRTNLVDEYGQHKPWVELSNSSFTTYNVRGMFLTTDRRVLIMKLETGTQRQGLRPDEALQLARYIARFPYLVLEGTCSHFANIEDTTDHSFAQAQLKAFQDANDLLAQNGFRPALHTHAGFTPAYNTHIMGAAHTHIQLYRQADNGPHDERRRNWQRDELRQGQCQDIC